MRRIPYQRAKNPESLRLTQRDIQILETIHSHDGLLSLKQIDRCFFSGKGRTQPRDRMRKLYDHAYVNGPTPQTIHQVPYGETIYWLDKKGAQVIAALRGENLKNFVWRKQPRWSLIDHDLHVNDFRLGVRNAVDQHPLIIFGEWLPESYFESEPDIVHYQLKSGLKRKRKIIPDGFFTIYHKEYPSPFAFFLEIDMGTEDNPRFAREKVIPGVYYLKSKDFQKRFGLKFARWLVVTTGPRRCQNMKAMAERSLGSGLFNFSTFNKTSSSNMLTDPIWLQAGKREADVIIPNLI